MINWPVAIGGAVMVGIGVGAASLMRQMSCDLNLQSRFGESLPTFLFETYALPLVVILGGVFLIIVALSS